ncbi:MULTISPECIES: glycosyltransferase family 2 protein [unclassified Romboutsia]|uniref:glycosyltransferase family 2 protein n=1 Tax=unclassified Romboutsia TaxID=2626894 RepID=UPI000820E0E7|nr:MULTISPECIES: glycosyltransferase family A protein [unclassified Romboutsia]SCH20374.1 Hyaluronan synthase [uncultured Clostridium sp.]
MVTLTVFTPTYNRGYILHRCYESLKKQTCKDFKWLIVDDGSIDNTKELVDSWIKNDNGFEINYVYKENGGMHTAHNKAYELIDTELNVCIDSDDFMPDDSVEIITSFWKRNGSNKYSGIASLDNYKNGDIVGDKFPNKKSMRLCDFYINGGTGDKNLIYRTDIMKKYPPYPEFEGEKFVPLDYKYLLADQEYELLILNKPTCTVEYLEDGSSRNIFKQYYKNPKGFAFMRKVHMKYDKKIKHRFKSSIHYVSSSIIMKNKDALNESPQKILTILAYPFGVLLYWLIRIKNREVAK